MATSLTKKIELTIDDKDLTFNVSVADYNNFVNTVGTAKSKIQVFHNFCAQTVTKDGEKDLMVILAKPGAAMSIGSELIEQYTPDINITAKKPTPTA